VLPPPPKENPSEYRLPRSSLISTTISGEDGYIGVGTLEEALHLAREKAIAVEKDSSFGSGTPYLAADGVLGASAITAGVFGGIAAVLIVKGRRGRYALQGTG